MFNIFSNFWIKLFQLVYNIVNAKTNFDALNAFTTAFVNLFHSNGYIAFDTFVSTLGNSFAVYDAFINSINIIKTKKKEKETEEASTDLMENLQLTLNNVNDQLVSIREYLQNNNRAILDGQTIRQREEILSQFIYSPILSKPNKS